MVCKPIPGFEDIYTINELGVVRNASGAEMRGWINKWGYPNVALRRPGCRKKFLKHRLVLLVFVGECPKGFEARHLDGDPGNARLSNLVWGSAKENADDKIRHGTKLRGTSASGYGGVINEEVVSDIRNKVIQGKSTRELSQEYEMSEPVVRDLINGRRWSHVPGAITRQRKTGKILNIDQ